MTDRIPDSSFDQEPHAPCAHDTSSVALARYQDRITRDPTVFGGEPVIKGTRVTLRTILASLAEGDRYEDIIRNFPTLTVDDIRTAVAFAAASATSMLPAATHPDACLPRRPDEGRIAEECEGECEIEPVEYPRARPSEKLTGGMRYVDMKGRWPGDVDDGFEEAIRELRTGGPARNPPSC